MRAHKISFLVILVLLAFAPQGFSSVSVTNEKPVQLVVDFYPNYAGHLLGVAEIGYQSNYADTYYQSVNRKDLRYLRSNAELLKWELGDEGPLTSVFISFPGYINPETKEELAEYLQDLNSAVAQKSFDDFYEKYHVYIKDLDQWCGFSVSDYIYDYEEEIQTLSGIFMDNFSAFKNWVWPIESKEMQVIANSMNYQLGKLDLISRWEDLTGLKYKATKYEVALSTGMANGPTGKALGYEKEWCYFGENKNALVSRICQDAGRRILFNVCCHSYNEYNPLLCFEVYEALNEYMTEIILDEADLKYRSGQLSNSQSNLFAIFDSIRNSSPEITASNLFAIALDDYSKAYTFAGQ